MQITSNTTASERCREPMRKMKQEERIGNSKASFIWIIFIHMFGFFESKKKNPSDIVLLSLITLSWSLGYVTSFPGRALHFLNLCHMSKSCCQPCFVETLPYQPSYFEGLASQMLTFQILLKRCGKKSYADTHSHLSQISSSIDRELQL